MSRRRIRWTAVVAAAVLIAAGCGGGSADDDVTDETTATTTTAPSAATTTQPDTDDPGPAVEVTFWHAMSGVGGEALQELTDQFNSSQDRVTVDAVYQGSYDEVYQQILAAFETGALPDIVQSFDMGTQTMIDTGRVIPVRTLIEAEGYDDSVFLTAVREYYSDEDGMVAMPFNTSTPVLAYNADLFAAAGVSPPAADESWSFSQLLEACAALEAGVVDQCIAFRQLPWFFEQVLANSGGLYLDENNGRTGRPTAVAYTDDRGLEVFSFLTDLVTDGHSANYGNNNDDVHAAFMAGEAAMMFNSSGGLGNYADADFAWGAMYLPFVDSVGERQGVVLGGGANYILDGGDSDNVAAAWEYLKFLASPEAQVRWHELTGFVPVRSDVLDDPTLLALWESTPAMKVAVSQLAESSAPLPGGTPNYAALGGRAGPLPAVRNLIGDAFSAVINDGVAPADALAEQAEKAAVMLADYNSFFDG